MSALIIELKLCFFLCKTENFTQLDTPLGIPLTLRNGYPAKEGGDQPYTVAYIALVLAYFLFFNVSQVHPYFMFPRYTPKYIPHP